MPENTREEAAIRIRLGLLEYLDLTDRRSLAGKAGLAGESAACAAEAGYERLWVAEHHGRLAPCASPLPVCAALGSTVPGIRVGTAVTLLRIRDPYLTAVDIHQASYFCASGFDAGLGRGDVKASALGHLRKDDERLAGDIAYLATLLREGNEVLPRLDGDYQMWLHGSGIVSAELAGKLGFNYCHALFFNTNIGQCKAAYARYRAAGGRGTTAIALAFAIGDPMSEAEAIRRWGLNVTVRADAGECARVAMSARALSGADEIIIAELSEKPEQHLRAIQEIHSVVGTQPESADTVDRQILY
ncbi:MAG TPA: LLM class flavin-dependent oxidoreductase [Streptosporangiaceae bacterium]